LKISIIIPCFNEVDTIEKIVEKVKSQNQYEKEIIIIDDFSTDGTREVIKRRLNEKIDKLLLNSKNFGKGYSVRQGIEISTGDIILIQDADLEYDPSDYSKLIEPIKSGYADVVYGSRFLGGGKYVRIHFFWHYLANKILTLLCNIIANLNLTDMETGYKLFRYEKIKNIVIKEKSFGFEPEITIKLAKKNSKFFEVPISYNGRSYKEGKKIGLKDAFIAVYCIFKYAIKN